MSGSGSDARIREGAWFTTTHWSVVLQARDPDTLGADEALEKLCRTYWPPLYAYIRRDGYKPEDAQDLTQEFISRFLHKEWLGRLHHQRSKFRTFLITFLKHFLSDQRDRANAQKRGGGKALISIDAYEAEERELVLPSNGLSPDEIFEQGWARSLLQAAIRRLEADYAARGQQALFDHLKELQPGKHGEVSYAQIGAILGKSEQAVRNAVLKFRERYETVLRDEIAQTVADPGEVEAELRHIMRVFAR
jgi:RNA polymerase sigma-70 factor (ECF subfamily)